MASPLRFLLSLLLTSSFVFSGIVVNAQQKSRSTSEEQAVHVLSRITFGARPADVERVKKIGVRAFIDEQLSPDSIDDVALAKRLEKLPTLNLTTPTIAEQYNPPKPKPVFSPTPDPSKMTEPTPTPTPQASPTATPKPTPTPKAPQHVVIELQRAKLLRAVYSERQLNELVVDFWANHFSIYANKDANRWLMTSFDRDSIRPYAMGRFRDLLGATAKSPAMLYYLDNWQSSILREYKATKDRPARTVGGINENYARELMELHTLGVDGGYSQKDIQEVARCFTGWTIRKPNEEGLFVFNPATHDNGEKTVLGVTIPAGGGIADGERVLDILAKHPSTAKFVATKLSRRFIGDDPPTAVVDAAAKTFLATDGSITATLRTILTSQAFLSPASRRTKVKTPFEFVASALRVTGAETDANRPVLDWISRMGQPVYGRVTPDGYPDRASEWLSNNDLISRFNFASALAMNSLRGTTLDAAKMATGQDPPATVAKQVLFGSASDRTLAEMERVYADSMKPKQPANISVAGTSWAANAKPPEDPKKAALAKMIALALGSPEFQRR